MVFLVFIMYMGFVFLFFDMRFTFFSKYLVVKPLQNLCSNNTFSILHFSNIPHIFNHPVVFFFVFLWNHFYVIISLVIVESEKYSPPCFSNLLSIAFSIVSRAQISAPPGFSAPTRSPPPGFTSQDKIDRTFFSASPGLYIGDYFYFLFLLFLVKMEFINEKYSYKQKPKKLN